MPQEPALREEAGEQPTMPLRITRGLDKMTNLVDALGGSRIAQGASMGPEPPSQGLGIFAQVGGRACIGNAQPPNRVGRPLFGDLPRGFHCLLKRAT